MQASARVIELHLPQCGDAIVTVCTSILKATGQPSTLELVFEAMATYATQTWQVYFRIHHLSTSITSASCHLRPVQSTRSSYQAVTTTNRDFDRTFRNAGCAADEVQAGGAMRATPNGVVTGALRGPYAMPIASDACPCWVLVSGMHVTNSVCALPCKHCVLSSAMGM